MAVNNVSPITEIVRIRPMVMPRNVREEWSGFSVTPNEIMDAY